MVSKERESEIRERAREVKEEDDIFRDEIQEIEKRKMGGKKISKSDIREFLEKIRVYFDTLEMLDKEINDADGNPYYNDAEKVVECYQLARNLVIAGAQREIQYFDDAVVCCPLNNT